MRAGLKIKDESRDLDHAHLVVVCTIARQILDVACLYTKFEDSDFTHSKDMRPTNLKLVAGVSPRTFGVAFHFSATLDVA